MPGPKSRASFRSNSRPHSSAVGVSISSAAFSRISSVISSTKEPAKILFNERGAAKVTRPAPVRIAARHVMIAAPVFPREPAITKRCP